MIDALFYWTGAVVWVLIAIHILLLGPVIVCMIPGWVLMRIGSWLDSRYYDGPEDVKQARDEGTWYYWLIHSIFWTRDKIQTALTWYVETVVAQTIEGTVEAVYRVLRR